MTTITIDLDKLRENLPNCSTWLTGWDLNDDEERDQAWTWALGWLQEARICPESDERGQSGARMAQEPQTGTQWPPPRPEDRFADLVAS